MTAACTTITTPYTTTTTTTWTPPPGGNGCLRAYFTCQCLGGPGSDTWVLAASDCVANSSCSGALACDPLSFYAEYFNGCLGGVPLLTPVPSCAPKCCAVTTTTTTVTYPPPPPPPPPTTPPPNYCEVQWAAYCSDGAWSVDDVPASFTCKASCTPSGWTINGNACNYLMTECLSSNCPDIGSSCTYGAKPAFNPAVPPCCLPPTTTTPPPATYCNCTYTSSWDCSSGVWNTPALGGCVAGASPVTSPWAYTSGCNASTQVSAAGACA